MFVRLSVSMSVCLSCLSFCMSVCQSKWMISTPHFMQKKTLTYESFEIAYILVSATCRLWIKLTCSCNIVPELTHLIKGTWRPAALRDTLRILKYYCVSYTAQNTAFCRGPYLPLFFFNRSLFENKCRGWNI